MSKFTGALPPIKKATHKTETPIIAAARKKRTGRPPARSSNPSYRQVTALVPRALYTDVSIQLLREEKQFSSLVEDLLRDWIAGK